MLNLCVSRMAALAALVALLACGGESEDVHTPPPGAASPQWTTLTSDDPRGAFMAVWGRGADDVYVAGGQPEAGSLVHWDGQVLHDEELPPGLPLLNWVHGVGESTWVVGNAGSVLWRDAAGGWTVQPSATTEDLWGVWMASATDGWAVGGDPATDAPPVILRWNGRSWSALQLPVQPDSSVPPPRAFFKVFGAAHDDVWIVGASGALLHWNGASLGWTSSGTRSDLVAGWALDARTALISGGRGNGELLFFDGQGWSATGMLPVGGLNASWADAESRTAWSVGERGEIVRTSLDTGERVRERSGSGQLLHGVWGSSAAQVFMVGGTLGGAPPWRGIIQLRQDLAGAR